MLVGRNRWVEYNPEYGLNYDASQIPAEWFGWLHHRTDLLPCQVGILGEVGTEPATTIS